MAGTGNTWHLVGLLVALPNCLTQSGPPPPPSVPECYIPHEESEQFINDYSIHCSWEPGQQDPLVYTSYIMHWELAEHNTSGLVMGSSKGGVLARKLFFTHSGMSVWVTAGNQHGNSTSQKAFFHIADILKPPIPIISNHSNQPLEISWRSRCDLKGLSESGCEVRHRAEGNSEWTLEEGQFQLSFQEDSPLPFNKYEFQVRCACEGSKLMSNWSSSYTVLSHEAAPVGKLDVWHDCGISTDNLECVLMWKRLPRSLARGQVLGYTVKLSYINGTQTEVNLSTADPGSWLICNGKRCYLTYLLLGVAGANVSAYNAHGATMAVPLAMQTSGPLKRESYNITVLKIEVVALNVSWISPQNPPDWLQGYLIQYKGAGLPLSQGFDWIQVNKTEQSAIITGTFENATAYLVSLFAVLKDSHQLLSSAVEYFGEQIPPKVPSFQEKSISATEVTLCWEPIPLEQRNGHILYYEIGFSIKGQKSTTHKVPNVNVSYTTYSLKDLKPGQDYLVWICAVTQAGAGPRSEIGFTTNEKYSYDHLIYLPAIALLLSIVVLIFIFRLKKEALVPWWCWEKVPDPSNSKLFQQMKCQLSDSLTWLSPPCMVPDWKSHTCVSEVEVIQIETSGFKTSVSAGMTEGTKGEECTLAERQEGQGEDGDIGEGKHQFRKEDYSEMIDSDEDREREKMDDSQSLEEYGQFSSGYETHFMPSAWEVEQ